MKLISKFLPKEIVHEELSRDKAIEQIVYLLKEAELTLAERNLLTGCVLDKLDALPLQAIISKGESGEILIHGEQLDFEKARSLRESARVALDNIAENLVDEQVLWIAITGGLHNGDSPEKLYFYRAAIWFGQQREQLLTLLAQRDEVL